MDLSPYVENLRQALIVAADAGGQEARALAERLTASLESATRLMLLDALSMAADEITRELAPGSVDVRLRGLDPQFVVTSPPPDSGVAPASPPPPEPEDGNTIRINLRLPEQLKARIEEAAGRERISLNAWLVRAASAAVQQAGRTGHRSGPIGEHFTGWVR
jgi:hypothetical protein